MISKTVTLSEGQGHLNWYQNVQFSGLYNPAKFQRNCSVNDQIQDNVKRICFREVILVGFSPFEYS